MLKYVRMRFRPEVDYYEILQVHPRASQEMINKAYRTLMGEMRGHPDLGGDEERAKLINEAHTVLADPDLRRAYDAARTGHVQAGWGGTVTPGGQDFERLAGLARKVALSVAVVASALVLARFLRSPTLDLADLAVMAWLLVRIWNQVSLPGRA
jgi:curved DNA-binding protein CbpA